MADKSQAWQANSLAGQIALLVMGKFRSFNFGVNCPFKVLLSSCGESKIYWCSLEQYIRAGLLINIII